MNNPNDGYYVYRTKNTTLNILTSEGENFRASTEILHY